MVALNNVNKKASIIGILMMPALKNIIYKASISGILIMVAFKFSFASDDHRHYSKVLLIIKM